MLDHSSARSYPRRCVRGYGYKGSVTPSAILTAAVVHAALGRDDGRAASMELSAASWKVSAAGGTPTAHDRPYDCELAG